MRLILIWIWRGRARVQSQHSIVQIVQKKL